MDPHKIKELQPNEQIVRSLINLRDELFDRKDSALAEAFFKINSCLYREYPPNYGESIRRY
jgi:hypothetical protein